MIENIFINLFRYKPVEGLTPEENFITEAFVYLLNQSKHKEDAFIIKFLELLKIHIDSKGLKRLKIETQNCFYTKHNIRAIPDITLILDNNYYFIEVKVSSDLNEYQIDTDGELTTINQIEKYKSIIIPSNHNSYIYTITNRTIDYDNKYLPFDSKLLWSDIYNLVSGYVNNTDTKLNLLFEFKSFMEDLKMNLPEVTYEYKKGMESFLNLLEQIELVLKRLNILHKRSIGAEYFGYYIYKNEQHRKETRANAYYGWIGSSWEPDFIKFQYNDPIAKSMIEKSNLSKDFGFSKFDKAYEKYFKFKDEHYYCLTAEEQISKLTEWIRVNSDLLNKLSDSKIE
jgi:hypothetical protein